MTIQGSNPGILHDFRCSYTAVENIAQSIGLSFMYSCPALVSAAADAFNLFGIAKFLVLRAWIRLPTDLKLLRTTDTAFRHQLTRRPSSG